MLTPEESTVSLRWIIPFMRITGESPEALPLLQREGIAVQDLANPEARIRHAALMELLGDAVRRTGDPLLGLRAAERVEAGDFETLGYACRSCANVREAIACAGRYMYLMHGAQETHLHEDGELAIWELRVTDNVEQLPAANDFALASAVWLTRHFSGERNVLREVHFRHKVATDEAEYARAFDGATIKLGMPHNALVFVRSHLDAPMLLAHPGLSTAFQQHGDAILARVRRTETVRSRVRKIFIEHLAADDVRLVATARRMAMSVGTLRRRLSEEGTTHRALLDDVRRELASAFLRDLTLSMNEVAFLLGFSHVTAFYKAYSRWSPEQTPFEFRSASQLALGTHVRRFPRGRSSQQARPVAYAERRAGLSAH